MILAVIFCFSPYLKSFSSTFVWTGCQPPSILSLPLLNSRTYNIVLETSGHTCLAHRNIRNLERDWAAKVKIEQTRISPSINGHQLTKSGYEDIGQYGREEPLTGDIYELEVDDGSCQDSACFEMKVNAIRVVRFCLVKVSSYLVPILFHKTKILFRINKVNYFILKNNNSF